MKLKLYFLYTTLLTIPFALRKEVLAERGYFFKEYSDISLYVFEIFLIGYILLSILEHVKYKKSNISKHIMFHMEHFLLLLILATSSISYFFLENKIFSLILLIKWIFYITFSLFLYFDLKVHVPRGTKYNQNASICSTWNTIYIILAISAIFQSFLVFFQILFQKSLGLYFLGEQIINVNIAGVSTIIIFNREILRGYGTFLHPNQTAFFLYWSLMLLMLINFVPRGTKYSQNSSICSTWNKIQLKFFNLFHVEQLISVINSLLVPRGTRYLYSFIILAIVLTFSKSIILVTFLSLLILNRENCSTWNKIQSKCYKLFHVEQRKYAVYKKIVPRGTIFASIIVVMYLVANVNYKTYIMQPILERKEQYLSIPYMGYMELVRGTGLGSYVQNLEKKSPGLFNWQMQPVHNTVLLAIYELGTLPIVILSIYVYFKIFKQRKKLDLKKIPWVAFALLIFLVNIDHYLWDLEQTQFLGVLLCMFLFFIHSDEYSNFKNRV